MHVLTNVHWFQSTVTEMSHILQSHYFTTIQYMSVAAAFVNAVQMEMDAAGEAFKGP